MNGTICGNGGCSLDAYKCTDGTHMLICVPQGVDCFSAKFVEGMCTDVHDDALEQATQGLNEVLQNIPADLQGRHLALIRANVGFRLAWVSYGSAPPGAVKITDQAEKNAVLGIEG
ncbi:MAG TPA: hypothetical protein VI756_06360 [Blastocatellia bacterium]